MLAVAVPLFYGPYYNSIHYNQPRAQVGFRNISIYRRQLGLFAL